MLKFLSVNTPSQWVDRQRRLVGTLGIAQSGPLDLRAFLHNLHIMQGISSIQLETFGVLSFTVDESVSFCVTGGEVVIHVDEHEYSSYQRISLHKGQIVKVNTPTMGRLLYLGFSAKPEVIEVLGSVNSLKREGFGGHNGDGEAFIKAPFQCALNQPSVLKQTNFTKRHAIFATLNDNCVPVIPGYQNADFSVVAKHVFIEQTYQISAQSNRMGYRLLGKQSMVAPQISQSQPIGLGAIQVPADGQPIALLADRQTMGGYPVLGCISRLGIGALTQAKGDVKFSWTSVEQARCDWSARLSLDFAILTD